MSDRQITLLNTTWAEKILFKTIVKIETLEVYDHTEGNGLPHHQVSANCLVLGGTTCLPGDIYFAVEPSETQMLEKLKTLLKPGAILWVTSKDIHFFPDEKQIISFYNPEIEAVAGAELDDLLISLFVVPNNKMATVN